MGLLSPSSILTLPNEILYRIFTFLCLRGDVSGILPVRQTCKKFRVIIHSLAFWESPDFQFKQLVPRKTRTSDSQGTKATCLPGRFLNLRPFILSGTCTSDRQESKETRLIKIFLNDKSLVECLRRKSTWWFSSLQSFSTVSSLLPGFQDTVTALYLFNPFNPDPLNPDPFNPDPFNPDPFNPDPFNPDPVMQPDTLGALRNLKTLKTNLPKLIESASLLCNLRLLDCDHSYLGRIGKALAKCPELIDLILRDRSPRGRELDLDEITNSCPSLLTLNLACRYSHFDLRGTLDGLSTLQELKIFERRSNFKNKTSFLPLSSAISLTTLSISCGADCNLSQNHQEGKVLDTFKNLKSLHVEPLSPEICRFITRAEITLSKFTCVVHTATPISDDEIVEMISARCISRVNYFGLMVGYLSLPQSSRKFLQTIKSALRAPQFLHIAMNVDPSWCTELALFKDLQKIDLLIFSAKQSDLRELTDSDSSSIDPSDVDDTGARRIIAEAFNDGIELRYDFVEVVDDNVFMEDPSYEKWQKSLERMEAGYGNLHRVSSPEYHSFVM